VNFEVGLGDWFCLREPISTPFTQFGSVESTFVTYKDHIFECLRNPDISKTGREARLAFTKDIANWCHFLIFRERVFGAWGFEKVTSPFEVLVAFFITDNYFSVSFLSVMSKRVPLAGEHHHYEHQDIGVIHTEDPNYLTRS